MQARSCLVFLAMLASLVSLCGPASGLVGEAGPAEIAIQRYTIVVYSTKGRCSGVVLAQDLMLTAAHCVESDEITYLVAGRVGLHTFMQGKVASVVRHPEFRKTKVKSLDADLAVIKLAEPLSAYFTPAHLEVRPISVGDRVIVAGYGKAGEQDAEVYATMRSAALVVLQRWSGAAVLASADGSLSGSCRGDSGGPVFTYRGLFALVGIMVSGNCGNRTTVVALSHYYDWIVEAALKLGSPLK